MIEIDEYNYKLGDTAAIETPKPFGALSKEEMDEEFRESLRAFHGNRFPEWIVNDRKYVVFTRHVNTLPKDSEYLAFTKVKDGYLLAK